MIGINNLERKKASIINSDKKCYNMEITFKYNEELFIEYKLETIQSAGAVEC
jgi:hypothetical protein